MFNPNQEFMTMKKLTSLLRSVAAMALIAGIAQPAAAQMVPGPGT